MVVTPVHEATGLRGAGGADVLLADGRIAVVRRLRADDGDGVHALHDRVSDESLRLRFFAAGARSAAHRYVDHVLAQPDQLTLVAEIGGRIVGLATSELVDLDTSEIAFLVADEMQGSGLGTLLLEHLAAAARDKGVRHFTADVLLENRKMLRVLDDAGFDVRRRIDHGEVIVDIDTGMTAALQTAVDDREAYAEAASLRPLLRPASVAIAGVRADGTGVGAAILRAVLEGGYHGAVTVIHPRARSLQGVPAVHSISELDGGAVDLLVLALPAAGCVDLLEQGTGRVGAAVAISSGFGELGGDGVQLQGRLALAARRSGIRLVGPNCLGVICNDPQVSLNATFSRAMPPPGGLAVASQSGAVGIVLMDLARRLDLGVSCFVSLGNKADVSGNDLLAAWRSRVQGGSPTALRQSCSPPARSPSPASWQATWTRPSPLRLAAATPSPSRPPTRSRSTGRSRVWCAPASGRPRSWPTCSAPGRRGRGPSLSWCNRCARAPRSPSASCATRSSGPSSWWEPAASTSMCGTTAPGCCRR
ncbi:hypothetical protein GCM10009843_16000 [Nocardioides bigeumensis]|uniref:N-acetyltransferase domain-containing protein n=1 Tax=Nocardioides bigeumensis TaxID=433657 RepID=A0ABN2Y3J7_9ACTN